MQSLFEIVSRELTARDKLKKFLVEKQPFDVSINDIQKISIGDLPLGYALTKNGTFETRLIRGLDTRLMYLIGMPGQGKTNLLKMLAHSAMLNNDKVIIVSRKGWEFSPLLKFHNNFYDLTAKEIRLNPFYPPLKDISQKEWNQNIASAISSEGWMVYASATNFEKHLDNFTEKFPNSLITPSKLVNFISARKDFKLISVDEKVKNRLEGLTSGEAKYIFDTNEIIDFEFYAKNNLNFNLNSLSPNQLSYFIAIFLTLLVSWKELANSKERHCIILDDFFDLVTEQNDELPRVSEMIKIITVFGRKLNIDLWIVAQSAFNTSKFVLDNATSVIRFKTGGISDKVLEQVLKLTEAEKNILAKCPSGFCVVQRKMVYNKAFLTMIPFVPIDDISREERSLLMEARIKEMREKYFKIISETKEQTTQEQEPNADEIYILKDYANSPYENITEKAIKLNYSTPTLVRHLKNMQEHGYLQEINVSLGKSVGVIKLFRFTEKAVHKVGKQLLIGRGSLAHGYYMQIIKRFYEGHGKKVEVEKYFEEVNGLVDVAVLGENGERLVALEIALSNKYEHECDNIEKCLKVGFAKVISSAPSENILKGIKQEALRRFQDLNNIHFQLLKEFYHGTSSKTK